MEASGGRRPLRVAPQRWLAAVTKAGSVNTLGPSLLLRGRASTEAQAPCARSATAGTWRALVVPIFAKKRPSRAIA